MRGLGRVKTRKVDLAGWYLSRSKALAFFLGSRIVRAEEAAEILALRAVLKGHGFSRAEKVLSFKLLRGLLAREKPSRRSFSAACEVRSLRTGHYCGWTASQLAAAAESASRPHTTLASRFHPPTGLSLAYPSVRSARFRRHRSNPRPARPSRERCQNRVHPFLPDERSRAAARAATPAGYKRVQVHRSG